MADKKSLSDLGELTNPKPEAPAVSEAPVAEAAPASAESSDNAPASSGGDGRRVSFVAPVELTGELPYATDAVVESAFRLAPV